MLTDKSLRKLKRITEERWAKQSLNPIVYGFQFQRGTRWNPGLSADRIAEYESVLGVRFPHDFRAFLSMMNGTDLPIVNIYGSCGEPAREAVGVYSYPRDIEIVKGRIEQIRASHVKITRDLAEHGYELPVEAGLVPIYGHRYLVCADLETSVVLSMVVDDTDAIVYANCLADYLEREFLGPRL